MSDSTTFPPRPAMDAGLATAARPGHAFVPGPIWARVLILLVALIGIKLAMIVGQGQSLYEMHWRIGGARSTWVDDFAFFAFVVFGGLSLVQLEKSCRSVSTRAVRTVNAVLLILGLSFLFLTFHNGDKNLLYPVLSGVLSWNSLSSYSANRLFFNEPFLAAWLFCYAFTYYVMVRSKRENWVISLTATFSVAYALLYLREFAGYRNELLIIDCIAAASFLMEQISRRLVNPSARRLALAWLMLPLSWVLFFVWALLRFDNQWHSNAATYFLTLSQVSIALFAAATLVVRRSGNPSAWSWFVAFYFVGFFLLADSNFPVCGNFNHLLCLAFTFPRYFSGDVLLVSLLGLLAFVLLKKWPRVGLWFMDLAALALILLSIIDLRLSQIMGVRLGWDVLSFGDSPRMMLKMALPYLPGLTAGLLVLVMLYVLALRALQAWSRRAAHLVPAATSTTMPDHASSPVGAAQVMAYRPFQLPRRLPGLAYVVALFLSMTLLGLAIADSDKAQDQTILRLVRTSPLWKRVASRPMNERDFVQTATALGLGDFSLTAVHPPSAAPRELNVLVVFMESSYNKHLSLFGSSEETQPQLSRYKDRMEVFPNFFSAFTGSIHARFATFTSLYPVLDFHAFTQERVPVKSLFEVLHDQGYTCSMFYSSFFDYTGFRDFLKNRGLDEMYDADNMPGQRGAERVSWGLPEEGTLGAIRSQLKKYGASHQRFCLTYVPAAPHYPYDKIPKAFQKYKMAELGDFKPLYLNELLYMDWVIASILDQLKESGLLDNTLVVITNDHGEMVGGKDGHVGHGWHVTPQLANTPLILMDPTRKDFQTNTTVGTQVDLLPTVLDRLNIPIPTDQLYQGLSLDAGDAREGRLAYLNSYKEFGIIRADQVLLGDREASSPSGPASTGATYRITNQGTETVFTLETAEPQNGDSTGAATGPENGASPSSAEVSERQSGKANDTLATSQARCATMARFDAFQESLLRNYEFYCHSLRPRLLTQAREGKGR